MKRFLPLGLLLLLPLMGCPPSQDDGSALLRPDPISTGDLYQFFENYERTGEPDALGFSLDRDMLRNLNQILDDNPEIDRVRILPGMTDSEKILLVGLFLNDETLDNRAYSIPFAQGSFRGPCPTWCESGQPLPGIDIGGQDSEKNDGAEDQEEEEEEEKLKLE